MRWLIIPYRLGASRGTFLCIEVIRQSGWEQKGLIQTFDKHELYPDNR